ncbi:ergothioneine biosynthesis protein EgtB [Ectothiorhodospiraceae bacterium WFHF3C12]|nr:ergothioneine biosynthesis protein EgtB [Ectothiorhodospiraceae bacterium WFHF3C12]
MTAATLIEALTAHHTATLAVAEAFPDEELRAQHHPLLSPLGWHVGHCSFIETLWVQGELLGRSSEVDRWKALYQPDMAYKPGRGLRLPERGTLAAWCVERHEENLGVLADPPARLRAHPLLHDDYLPRFLLQHYAQHLETMDYVRAQRDPGDRPVPSPANEPGWIVLPPGRYGIGATGPDAYDNEQEMHCVRLAGARLGRRPVTNDEFAEFMADGGYERPELWDDAGWQWRARHGVDRPGYWARHRDQGPPRGDSAVQGLSHFEATAYARWAGARLPHEYEWEAAHRHGLLAGVGSTWEWCANPFHPYPGFLPFPYEGYSNPWFDGRHYVLRGASASTRPAVRRPSFRNFYTREVRHVFSGLRLALDL